jgi:hypothetical protein
MVVVAMRIIKIFEVNDGNNTTEVSPVLLVLDTNLSPKHIQTLQTPRTTPSRTFSLELASTKCHSTTIKENH